MYNFLDYVLNLSPSVLSIPRLGHLNTLDGYNRAVTFVPGSTPTVDSLVTESKGFSFFSGKTSVYNIDHGAEQLFTDQTVIMGFPRGLIPSVGNQYIVTKWSASGFAWLIRLWSNVVLSIFNSVGANKSGVLTNLLDIRTLAIVTIGSSSIEFYANGTLLSSTTGLDFSSQPTEKINVGGVYNGGSPPLTPIDLISIHPSALTGLQIAKIHNLFQNVIVSPEPKKTYYIPEQDTKGAVVDLWGQPNYNNIISDKSGNGNNATVSGRVIVQNNSEDLIYESHSAGDPELLISDSAVLNDNPQQTIRFFINAKSAGESSEGRIFDKGSYYAFYNGTDIDFRQGFSGTEGRWTFPVPIDSDCFVQITYDKSDVANDPVAYVNGTSVTVTETQAPVGTYTTDVGSDLYIFDRAANDRAADCKLSYFRIFPSILSSGDLTDESLKFAIGHVRKLTPRYEHPVTLSAITAPNHVGPWTTLAGSHEWLDDGTESYLQHGSAAKNYYASIQNDAAYGFYYVKYRPGAGGAFVGVPWAISSKANALYSAAGQLGYYLIHNADGSLDLREMTGGATASLSSTAASWLPSGAVDIELGIARRVTDGRITVYTRESNHTTWTQAIQATDNTTTSCKYIQNYTDVNGYSLQIRNVIILPYGDSLLPNDIDFLKD